MTPVQKRKVQHWRAFRGINGWEGAPVLGFTLDLGPFTALNSGDGTRAFAKK